jgi:hypothetical protein
MSSCVSASIDWWRDALHRKETFGTRGTRTKIRLFAGYDFPTDLHTKTNWVELGYQTGVPQGGDLSKAPEGKAPTLMVWAQREGLAHRR